MNEKLLQILEVLSKISNSMVVSYPTMSITNAHAIEAIIDLESLGVEEFDEFGLSDYSSFKSVQGLVKDAQVSMKNGVFTFKKGKEKYTFVTSGIMNLQANTLSDKQITQVQKTVSAPSVLEFKLDTELISKITAAAKSLKQEELLLSANSESQELVLTVGNSDKRQVNKNQGTLDIPFEILTKDFDGILKIGHIEQLPKGEYTIQVKYNKAKDAFRVIAVSDTIDTLMMLIPLAVEK